MDEFCDAELLQPKQIADKSSGRGSMEARLAQIPRARDDKATTQTNAKAQTSPNSRREGTDSGQCKSPIVDHDRCKGTLLEARSTA